MNQFWIILFLWTLASFIGAVIVGLFIDSNAIKNPKRKWIARATFLVFFPVMLLGTLWLTLENARVQYANYKYRKAARAWASKIPRGANYLKYMDDLFHGTIVDVTDDVILVADFFGVIREIEVVTAYKYRVHGD